ncbi:uncharacterized protein LOC116144659 [Pistacia vera]|uniref:Uncharacterized protein n=1 Tax=Pistacia atlantica TaxID=434234 RepID=A0ACC1AVZ2_9ROSI|nr:uncharacterized protein LOC116144611 [Pistacia vera]XP_031285977.1 uncharacterized protein LOC116144659 [Pistacia vera]KAJ0090844.1 hypothetical protein Patl1_14568 [Pistacia atlantica]
MKRVLSVLLFIFLICCKALPYSSSESTLTSKATDGFGSKVMKSKPKGVYEALHLGNVGKGKEVFHQMKKANKGVYGGGDTLRPKRKKGGASSSLVPESSSLVLWTLVIELLFFLFI